MISAVSIRRAACLSAAAIIAAGVPVESAEAQFSRKKPRHGGDSDQAKVGYIMINDIVVDRPGPFDWLAGSDAPPALRSLVDGIDEAGERGDIDALVIHLQDAGVSLSHSQELGQAMRRASDAGVDVHVYADAYGTGDLLMASYADTALGQAGAPVSFPGLYGETFYLRDTLEWVGVTPDFVQIGDYKGADETYMNAGPSPEWEKNISQLLDGVYAAMRKSIKDGRGMSDQQLDDAMAKLWYADSETAAEMGLIDEVIDGAARPYIEEKFGGEVEWVTNLVETGDGMDFDAANPFAMFSMFSSAPSNEPKRETIAVVHVDGAIVDGYSADGGLFGGGSNVGSRTMRKVLADLRDDDLVKGVILRINSPGGSATASEVIWRGVRDLSEEKPVWVSVGGLAASGGYYIAVSGDKIFVTPSSIVGSIGVVGGKLAMGGVYEKLKLGVVSRTRGPVADMMSSAEPWSDTQRDMVRDMMQQTYEQFTGRVSEGRPGIDLGEVAEGRLFVGNKAVRLNMADEIGTLDDSIAQLAEELDLQSYDVLDFPGPASFEDLLNDAFGGIARAPGARGQAESMLGGAIEALVGENVWRQLRPSLEGIMMLRDHPVILLDVRPTIFR